ncbi:hypothetical protein [Vibrio sp. 10N.239.312.D08]|uniref:hypothetical protein n=1 Tax=Vibrio sp. 10N.239.312.D08 TaxID=3229978 RepID=UPI00354B1634
MASKNAAFYSCKFNRPETIKSHRTLASAIKMAGDYGMIFDRRANIERQVHMMSNGQLESFSEGRQYYAPMQFKFSEQLVSQGLIEA